MTRKKKIKQLMALGIQRNDAAGFVNASRILIEKGIPPMVHAVPPQPPVIVSQLIFKKYAACVTKSLLEMSRRPLPMEDLEKEMHTRLAKKLGTGLLESGLCEIHRYHNPNTADISMRAEITVAVPREAQT